MADLVKDIKYLRYYYTSEDQLKDKDILKNQTFQKYANTVSTLFLVPTALQFWQIYLVNNVERLALYRKVRALKFVSFLSACALGFNEKLQLEYQWQYYNRFYPEPTELQKTLTREALSFKEAQFQAPSQEEITQMDPDTAKIYEQMYRLPPQTYPDPDDNPNAPSITPHW